MLGQTVGHYRIVEKLGAGGMGEVYRALDERLADREIAVKVLRPGTLTDETARRRLRKEAQALAKLSHPNIEFLFEYNTDGPVEFLAVEYVSGCSLSERLAEGPMPVKEIIRLGMQMADGLAAAHDRGVVHCDLKPANLRITPDGHLKIIDFGIAKLLRPAAPGKETTTHSTDSAAVIGTLPYMSPEQLRSEATDGRTDIYAAGVVLYEAATNHRPFRDESAPALIDAILHQPPITPRALNGRVTPELERIILKCLQKQPEDRYQSAHELEVDLRQLADPRTAATPLADWHRHWRRAAAIAALAVVLITGTLAASRLSGWWDRIHGRNSAGHIESLAVLPLENLSGDSQQEYFADGMTDELTTDLAQIKALRVICWTSAKLYKGSKKPLRDIARELHVEGVVEGSVLRFGERVRITARLVQAATDQSLWAQSYERDERDVLTLQNEVAQAIVDEIRIKLTANESVRLQAPRTVNPAAHEAYLRGRYFWNMRDRESVEKGLQYFRQAVELDPGYALAYAGIADSYIVLADSASLPPQEAVPAAKTAAQKAVDIDDSNCEGHTSLAQALDLGWEWEGAEREYKRALALNPGYATAHQWFAAFLSNMRRHEEAISEARRATELDPLSAVINIGLARAFYFARRYGEAKQAVQRTLEVSRDYFYARVLMGMIDLQDHQFAESVAELQEAAKLSPGRDDVEATLGYAQAVSGRQSAARVALEGLKEQSRRRYVSRLLIALVDVGLNKKEEAFEWLAKAHEQRDTDLPTLGVEPMFDPVRSDSRFHDLLRRMNLPR